ncbi:NAD-dependent epimerase/dehydratase family protein [Planctomicrobium sp. SH664]|uniref:NAD-dependent epimerase/dehydratase family protein n=1 Tax=Planctomicrobium sp. SH664 TaxID=3448125 RepID=UPI003F5C680A
MTEIRRIAITGSSGYCGRGLIHLLREVAPDIEILGLDLAPAASETPDQFRALDSRDSGMLGAMREFAPDTVVHMAFVMNLIHDDRKMHDINVNGTRNVLAAVAAIQPARFLCYSSMTAFGAWPDNPVPMDESWPLRARSDFRYAADKTELEADLAKFRDDHPEIQVSWVRPAVVLGKQVSNYLSRYILDSKLIALPDGYDCPLQFVHEDDVARATWEILSRNGAGPFNVGPPDWITWGEVGRRRKVPVVRIPLWLIRGMATIWWTLRVPPLLSCMACPPGLMNFIRYPWVGRASRLEQEFGFEFRHSSSETFQEALEASLKPSPSITTPINKNLDDCPAPRSAHPFSPEGPPQ